MYAAWDAAMLLMRAGRWVPERDLRRQMGEAERPRCWSAAGFRRLMGKLVRWGLVEGRCEVRLVRGTPARRTVYRLAREETAEGPVPRLLLYMRRVVREEYEERTARLARVHLRGYLRDASPEP
jgi:hypothetical protein